MNAHLVEISAQVDIGAHAVLILDQAGWHASKQLKVPGNITLLFLPPKSPELNLVENVWQYLRDNWLSNRVFRSYDDIVAMVNSGVKCNTVCGCDIRLSSNKKTMLPCQDIITSTDPKETRLPN